jgi:hypothetical protein
MRYQTVPVYAGHLPGPAVLLPVGKGEIAAFPKLLPCSYAVTWANKRKFILLDLVLYTNPQTVSLRKKLATFVIVSHRICSSPWTDRELTSLCRKIIHK